MEGRRKENNSKGEELNEKQYNLENMSSEKAHEEVNNSKFALKTSPKSSTSCDEIQSKIKILKEIKSFECDLSDKKFT